MGESPAFLWTFLFLFLCILSKNVSAKVFGGGPTQNAFHLSISKECYF